MRAGVNVVLIDAIDPFYLLKASLKANDSAKSLALSFGIY